MTIFVPSRAAPVSTSLTSIATESVAIKLGMCGFTIGAAAYYKKFKVVEVQQTFYDPPPRATLERWRAQDIQRFRELGLDVTV